MRRAALLLLTLTLPLFAQRYELGDRELVPAGGERSYLHAASSRSGHLLVWQDGWTFSNGYTPQTLAARISADGEVLDPAGIPLEPYAGFGVLASDGTDYLFLARSLRDRNVIDAARITADGTAVSLPPLSFPTWPVALAWNGSEYGLLHEGTEGLRLTPLNRDGSVRGGSIALPRCEGVLGLAGTVGRWLVTAGTCRALVSSTDFPPAGTTKEVAFPPDGTSRVAALASDGAGFLAVRLNGAAGRYDIESLAADGRVVATTSIPMPSQYPGTITVVRDGDAILLADGLKAVRISGGGVQPLEPPGAAIRAGLRLLPSPSGVLAVWLDGRFETVSSHRSRQIAAAIVGSAAWNAGGTIVSLRQRWQDLPAIGRGAETAVAAWTEISALPARVAIQPLALDGRPLASPLHYENAYPYARPAVAFDGSSFLVIWAYETTGGTRYGFRGVRLGADGTLAAEILPIEDGHAWQGPISLTAHAGGWELATAHDLYRLRPDGSVLERRPLPKRAEWESVSGVHPKPFGNDWLGLAYIDHFPGVGSVPVPREWRFVRLDPSFQRGLDPVQIGYGVAGNGNASFAWNGERGLVVWWDGLDEKWKALPLKNGDLGPIVADGVARSLPYGPFGDDAQVEATQSGFLVAARDVVALHALDGSLLALHRLPPGAGEARLVPIGDRDVLVVYTEIAGGMYRVFAERFGVAPKRRSAR